MYELFNIKLQKGNLFKELDNASARWLSEKGINMNEVKDF